ncbi:MAG: xanthine dehydrogenase family protein molybdopterin-binding subunit [Anaerolineae bacterium]|jgi:CO/xanthine dehydrogenase Mo-binding subunit
MTRAIGRSLPRIDAWDKVTGHARYPGDFSMPGMLHAKVVWSAHPHARVRRIDTSRAEAVPGVVQILTYQDVPVNEYGINITDQPVLVAEEDKVRWVGDRIAVVVAETERAAEEARRLVHVHYDPLPVVSDPREAMKPDAPLVHDEQGDTNILKHIKIRRGDVEVGFAQADVVVEGYYVTPHVEHAYLQPEAGLGYIDEEGRVTVVCAAQWPYDDVHQIAHMLNLQEDEVREIVPAVGGAFGGREDMYIQHLLALCAYVLRRPVKMVFTREESIARTGKRHPFTLRHRWGATRDGKLTAVEIEGVADAGAYASTSVVVISNATSFFAGPYVVPNARIDGYAVYTNNAVTMAMRGFGATQPPVGYEQQMDRLAEALGMDPVELRSKNLFDEGSLAVTGNRMPPGVGVKETLRQAAQAAGWREERGRWLRPSVEQPSAPYKRRGIGVASAYKNVGYSFGFDDKATALVELTLSQPSLSQGEDGAGEIERALVRVGASDVGEGVHTALAQIAAEALGIPLARVEIALLDTAEAPDAGSSSASRHTYMSGNAVLGACREARARWEAAQRTGGGARHVEAEHTFRGRSVRPTTPYDPETGQCEPHITYGYATQIALVEVDIETGQVEVLKVWAAHDVGRAVNPDMIAGQTGGGVHMGVGYALMEHFIQEEGEVRTDELSEYLVPTALDMPELVPIIVEVPDPTGPYGAKGVGEMTTLPTAPAILNAIRAATGVRITELPATSERVRTALRKGTEWQ